MAVGSSKCARRYVNADDAPHVGKHLGGELTAVTPKVEHAAVWTSGKQAAHAACACDVEARRRPGVPETLLGERLAVRLRAPAAAQKALWNASAFCLVSPRYWSPYWTAGSICVDSIHSLNVLTITAHDGLEANAPSHVAW